MPFVSNEIERKQELAEKLLTWWRLNKRDFPWRRTNNPYKILIAELLLRKTTAKQVEAVFRTFFSRYQDPKALANASEKDLEDIIRPLGMEHKRAVLLKAVGKEITLSHGGKVPVSREELLDLPGVGPYAANAVLCFAYGNDVPLVDTNSIRVFHRVYGFQSRKRRPRDDQTLWNLIAEHIPKNKAKEFNLAVIDHAHNICGPIKPKCFDCPIADVCDYYHSLLILEKKLEPTERRYHLIRMPKNLTNIFPYDSSTEVWTDDRKVLLKVDSYGRMYPAHLLWEDFIELLRLDPDTDAIAFKWKTPEKKIVEVGVRRSGLL